MKPEYQQLDLLMKTEAEMKVAQSDKLIIERAIQKILKEIMENPKK